MSVTDIDCIDAIGVERSTGKLILTIADHLEWDECGEHLQILQEKMDAYRQFVQSEQLGAAYPDAIGRALVIDIVAMHTPRGIATEFLERAGVALAAEGIELRVTVPGARQ